MSGISHIVIIGGGASGVLIACQLLRKSNHKIHLTLIERTHAIGRGVAYGTDDQQHVLNVRASNMSAYPDDPSHFTRWLASQTDAPAFDVDAGMRFAPRQLYGRYLADTLADATAQTTTGSQLTVVSGDVLSIKELDQQQIELVLSSGQSIRAEGAVLALGQGLGTKDVNGRGTEPFRDLGDMGISPKSTILVQGSGLTMIDAVLSLRAQGHTGKIVAISRRGLLPATHRPVHADTLAENEIPFGTSVTAHLRWLRRRIRERQAANGDWRSVLDALRPFTARLWRELSSADKARFLRHARPWWDVHRHRAAPDVANEIRNAITVGQLQIIAGKILDIEQLPGFQLVTLRRRHASTSETMQVSRILKCIGFNSPLSGTHSALIRQLLQSGMIREDASGIGIDVTSDCCVISADNRPNARFFVVGPLTRGLFWEITAIPDIRNQCSLVAENLLTTTASVANPAKPDNVARN